jgi:anti-anti-sigma regulatory factor
VSLQKRVREQGHSLVLCNLHPLVQEVFRITRLTQLFEIRV